MKMYMKARATKPRAKAMGMPASIALSVAPA